jgi:hypothetical protein
MPHPVKRRAPLSIRLTDGERDALCRRAGSQPISAYIKVILFGDAGPSGISGTRVLAEKVLLAQLLGRLGSSGLASSLGRLADAADSGSLHIDDLTTRRLHDAFDDVRSMHQLLMHALGKEVPSHLGKATLSERFLTAGSQEDRP